MAIEISLAPLPIRSHGSGEGGTSDSPRDPIRKTRLGYTRPDKKPLFHPGSLPLRSNCHSSGFFAALSWPLGVVAPFAKVSHGPSNLE
jgi:hypothetical protein